MKNIILITVFGAIFFMWSAHAQEHIAKVSALESGELLLNGEPATLDMIETEFEVLKSNNGGVWYYRENPMSEPTPQAMSVIELIVEHELPISLSSKPDFSDYIDENGKSHPRDPRQEF